MPGPRANEKTFKEEFLFADSSRSTAIMNKGIFKEQLEEVGASSRNLGEPKKRCPYGIIIASLGGFAPPLSNGTDLWIPGKAPAAYLWFQS